MKRVVLGLDQGGKTGWGIAAERSRVVRHGLAKSTFEAREVIDLALSFAGGDPRWLWIVFEKHDHIDLDYLTRSDRTTRRRGPRQAAPERPSDGRTLIGMGANRGRWETLLDLANVPGTHRLEVTPTAWRSRVHGVTRGDVKQAAIDWCRLALGEEIVDDNEAEGVCITSWGALDGLATYDGELTRARIENRAKRAAEKQGRLF